MRAFVAALIAAPALCAFDNFPVKSQNIGLAQTIAYYKVHSGGPDIQ